MPARPQGATWTKPPRIVESLVYRRDRVGFYEDGYTHIYVVPADGGSAHQVTSGNWNHGQNGISWTPDGQKIVFSSLRVEDADYAWRESDIYAVDVDSGEIDQLTDRKGIDRSPIVSPNGRRIAYTGYDWNDDTYNTSRLYIMDIDGSNPRSISTSIDRSPSGIRWAEDDSGVFFNVNDHGTRNLYFASTNGDVDAITEGYHMLTTTDINSNGLAAGVRFDPHHYSQLVTFSIKSPELKTLVDVNEDVLSRYTLGEVEEINYVSVDDFPIQGWIIKPPNFDPSKKYPMILAIHGGPHGMYNVAFSYAWQVHAAEGYVVLYTNPRGSSGYGKDFGNAI